MLLLAPLRAGTGWTAYTPDGSTLHLWHLDEAASPYEDAGIHPLPLRGKGTDDPLQGAGPDGFGRALSFRSGGPRLIAVAPPDPASGEVGAFPVCGPDGAFTFEALVKLDQLPEDAPGDTLEIIGMDDDNPQRRVFNLRIDKPGFLTFNPMYGNTVLGGEIGTLPRSGPHALKTGVWFHVAAVYDGRETQEGNFKLYWTRLDAGGDGANLIGRGNLGSDLNPNPGTFAVGNAPRSDGSSGPGEAFPGSIDEVRISSIAREPEDFFFVSAAARQRARKIPHEKAPEPATPLGIALQGITVSGKAVAVPAAGAALELPTGLHRLDIDFGFLPGNHSSPSSVSCRLEGLEDGWHPSASGMSMEWEMLDGVSHVVARRVFSASGSSKSWASAPFAKRKEAIYLPEGTESIRLTLRSGLPDTTGVWVVHEFALRASSKPGQNLWEDGELKEGEHIGLISGTPRGWEKRGSDLAITRLIQAEWGRSLGLTDYTDKDWAAWVTTRRLAVRPGPGGETFIASWQEAFKVDPGASQRASYINVAPGNYIFRAVALEDGEHPGGTQLALAVTVRQPYWKRAWFIPLVVASALLALGLMFFAVYRHRARRRLAALRLQHAVERDRVRIARDMHDDLGTRVSVLNLTAARVRRSVASDPEKAVRQLARMETAARDLVHAMHGLVWVVNPANDTLDHLANHLSAAAGEMFRDSPSKLRIRIAQGLPKLPLSSEFRHHFAMGVKEALHNALKHAGLCEVSLQLFIDDDELVAEIADTGAGFDSSVPREGNGLVNLRARLAELGGTFSIQSTPGEGTRIVLRCKLKAQPALTIP